VQRIRTPERPDWKAKAERLGFIFHTMYGEAYWDETAYYQFSLRQIEDDLEDPSAELHQMALELVDDIIGREDLLEKLAIPRPMWQAVADSWLDNEPSLYGRFDLAYGGTGPAKMLEYNADTPTSLYESAYFQWVWLEDMISAGHLPDNTDQYNALQDMIITRFGQMFETGSHIHFAASAGVTEDRQTVRYLEDCAAQAGMQPHYLDVDAIGLDPQNRFADTNGNLIQSLFKLYPWEDMFREDYAEHLPTAEVTWLEPLWKSILSNKGFLPLIWAKFKGHPNLLPAYFEGEADADQLGPNWVRKPLFSREGANVEIHGHKGLIEAAPGDYGAEGYIIQQYHALPEFDGNHVVIGSWIVGDEPAGIAIREDSSRITKDLSRFLPHIIAA